MLDQGLAQPEGQRELVVHRGEALGRRGEAVGAGEQGFEIHGAFDHGEPAGVIVGGMDVVRYCLLRYAIIMARHQPRLLPPQDLEESRQLKPPLADEHELR